MGTERENTQQIGTTLGRGEPKGEIILRKEEKHYRIVSENGEALLLTRKCFHNLMATLDVLADKPYTRPEEKYLQKKS